MHAQFLPNEQVGTCTLPYGDTRSFWPGTTLAGRLRWTSLWAWGFLGLAMLVIRRLRVFRPRELALIAWTFFLCPLLIYVISYIPWMLQAPSVMADGTWGPWARFKELPQHTRDVWSYHANLRATHPYFSDWRTWPWLKRPTWYYFSADPFLHQIRGIIAIGNPVLWWVAVPVSVWSFLSGLLERDWRRTFTGIGFFMLYLPWGLSPRQLNYSHYLFEAIPYVCLSLGWILDRLWSARMQWATFLYLALLVAVFALFFPMLVALPVPDTWFNEPLAVINGQAIRLWAWFPSWI